MHRQDRGRFVWVLLVAVLAVPSAARAGAITVTWSYTAVDAYVGEYMGSPYLTYTVPNPPVLGQSYDEVILYDCDAHVYTEQAGKTLTYDPEFEYITVICTQATTTPAVPYLASLTLHYAWAQEPGTPIGEGDWVQVGLTKTEGTMDLYWYEYDAVVMPEPAAVGLLAMGAAALLKRRR